MACDEITREKGLGRRANARDERAMSGLQAVQLLRKPQSSLRRNLRLASQRCGRRPILATPLRGVTRASIASGLVSPGRQKLSHAMQFVVERNSERGSRRCAVRIAERRLQPAIVNR